MQFAKKQYRVFRAWSCRRKIPRPDLHERLERVLTQTKPDLVFARYGMNDGIYLPLIQAVSKNLKRVLYGWYTEVLKQVLA